MKEYSDFSEDIQVRLRKMDELRFSEPEKVIPLAEILYKEASEAGNDGLMGYADFFAGDAWYCIGNVDSCLYHMKRAIRGFERVGNWYKEIGCYILLGIVFSNQGDTSNAFASYREALILAQENEDIFDMALIYENYSEICDMTENEDKALQYALLARRCILKSRENPRFRRIYAIIQTTVAKLDLKAGKLDHAERIIAELRRFNAENNEDPGLDMLIIDLLCKSAKGDIEHEEESVRRVMQNFDNNPYRSDYFMYILLFMKYLRDKGMNDILSRVIEEMEDSLGNENFPAIQLKISDFKVELLEEQHREDELLIELRKYRTFFRRQQEQNSKTVRFVLDLQSSLECSRKVNGELQKKVGTDELTGIANRWRLRDKLFSMYKKAESDSMLFAIEMMDIDHFKEINDTYGHAAGDKCLTAVAEVLKDISDEKCFPIRYGGDEFMILYTGQSQDELDRICHHIRMNVQEKIKETDIPDFTISQGVFGAVPDSSDHMESWATRADHALYQGKNLGGDAINLNFL